LVVVVEDDFFCEQRYFVLTDQALKARTNLCILPGNEGCFTDNNFAGKRHPVDKASVVLFLSTGLLA